MACRDGRTPRGRFFRVSMAITAAYAVVLVCATHYPKPERLLGPHAPSDKTLHFIAYAGLGLLAAATLAASARWTAARALGLAAGLALFGVADEVSQPWFRRAAEPLDWAFDCLGIAVGIAVVAALVALRPAAAADVQ